MDSQKDSGITQDLQARMGDNGECCSYLLVLQRGGRYSYSLLNKLVGRDRRSDRIDNRNTLVIVYNR